MTERARSRLDTWGPLALGILLAASGWAAFYVHARAAELVAPVADRVTVLETQRKADKETIEAIQATLLRIDGKIDSALARK